MATARGQLVVGEGVHHERQRRRDQRRGADGLDDAEHDEQLGARRQPAGHRGDGEHDRAGQEHLAVPDAVGELAGGDEHRGEHDRVGVEHPRQLRRAGVGERRGDVGEGDVEDRRVEERRQDRQRGDRQRAAGVVVHGAQPCAVRRVWNDSATTVPSSWVIRPRSTASPPVLSWISKLPASQPSSPRSEPAAVDVDGEVDAHPARRRLDTGERGRREAVGRHHQPGGIDRTTFERPHVAADVGAVTGERHPLRVEPQLEPSEAHHMSGRLERHAVRRRRQLQLAMARATRPRLVPPSGSGG